MRGQFIRGDGLILPNNISIAGAQMILAAAFRNTVPTLWAGLVTGMPDVDMTLADMEEPTIGTNGYARIEITRDAIGWPVLDENGGESYIETEWLEWIPTDYFNSQIQRVALFATDVADPTNVIYALSVPLPEPIALGPLSPQADRRFKYQVYL